MSLATVFLGIMSCSDSLEQGPWHPDAQAASIKELVPSTEFGVISGIALGSDGRVYVADLQGGVTIYSPDGSRVASLDKLGNGPGDLSMPCCLDISSDNRLWVSDIGNRRYSIFDVTAQPELLGTVPNSGFGMITTDRLQRYMQTGVYHTNTVQGGEKTGTPIVETLDSTGAMLASETLPPRPDRIQPIEVRREVPGGVSTNRMVAPFGPVSLVALGPGYYVRAVSDTYRVEIVPLNGGRPLIIERQTGTVLLSAREADSASTLIAEWVKAVGGKLEELELPPMTNKPVIQAIGIDHEGRVWVQRSVPDGSPSVADLYSKDGRYIESRQWPPDIQLVSWAARGAEAIGVRTFPSGEQALVLLSF